MIFLFLEWEASQEQIQESDLFYFNGKGGDSWIVQNEMKENGSFFFNTHNFSDSSKAIVKTQSKETGQPYKL